MSFVQVLLVFKNDVLFAWNVSVDLCYNVRYIPIFAA